MEEKVFQYSLHRELWLWLADNPGKEKSDWPKWKSNGGDIKDVFSDCFACEYTKGFCHDCPLIWLYNDDDERRCDFGGLWDVWDDDKTRSELARQIANLPVHEGVKYI